MDAVGNFTEKQKRLIVIIGMQKKLLGARKTDHQDSKAERGKNSFSKATWQSTRMYVQVMCVGCNNFKRAVIPGIKSGYLEVGWQDFGVQEHFINSSIKCSIDLRISEGRLMMLPEVSCLGKHDS